MPDPTIGLVLGGGSLLSQVGRELTTAVERQLAPFGLTAQQAALLLNAAPGTSSPSQLAKQLGTDTAGMTRLLDRLQDKGFLQRTRHEDDRRAVVVELTPHGLSLVPKLPPIFGKITKRLFTGFTAAEITTLTGLLRRMLDNLA